MRNTYKIEVGKPEGKKETSWGSMHKWEHIITILDNRPDSTGSG
jgi:hypothetical protein